MYFIVERELVFVLEVCNEVFLENVNELASNWTVSWNPDLG